jgi:amino acid transporter
VAVLGLLHITLNAKVLALLLGAEIAVVLLFDVAAVANPAPGGLDLGPLLPTHLVTDGVGGVFALSVAAFVGYESALAYGEEARRHTAVARATFGSLAFLGILYALSSWAMVVAVGPANVVDAARDPASGIPISFIALHYGPIVGLLASLLLVTSVFAAMLSFHQTAARYVFVLSRERVLPAQLGRIGGGVRAGAPIGGSLLQSGVALLVVATCAIVGADPMGFLFTYLASIAAVGIMTLMVACSVAAVGFYRRGGGTNEGPWIRIIAPTLSAVAVGLVLATTVANLHALLGTGPGSPATVAVPGVVAAAGLAGMVWGLVVRRRPGVARGVGRGEPEPLAELEHHLATVDV